MRPPGLVLLAAGLLAPQIGCQRGCELLFGPRARIEEAVAALTREPLVVPGEETSLHLTFGSETITVEGAQATVFVRADVEGRMRGVPIRCLCIERIPFRRTGEGWRPEGFPLPRLEGVVEALEARRAAFEAGDLDAYEALVHPDYEEGGTDRAALLDRLRRLFAGGPPPRQEILARHARVEARRALVTETYRIRIDTPAGPKEETGRARYVLRPTPDGWRFVGGLL